MEKVIDVIECEMNNDVFVYKHPIEDFNIGSQLIVHESQVAIFFYNGEAQEEYHAGKYTVETANMPWLGKIPTQLTGGKNMFRAEVYFINIASHRTLKWGTDSKVRMFDPATGLTVELGASGTFDMEISHPKKLLLKVVGTEHALGNSDLTGQGATGYTSASMEGSFRGLIISKVKSFLPRAIRENNINVLEVDERSEEIGEFLRKEINKVFEEYGLTITHFYVTRILTPDDDPNYVRLKQQHADEYLKVREQEIKAKEARAKMGVVEVEAQTEAMKRKIAAEAEAEVTKMTGFAEAEVMRAKGYTYQQETQRQVGVALAENESAGGAGGIAATMAQMGAGIGMGVAVGKQTAQAVQGVVDPGAGTPPNPPSAGWECPNCHAHNTGKFCSECGTAKPAAPAGWYCPECGAKNEGKFCSECGTPRPNK